MNEIALEPGSFRDRTARVFYHDGKVLRGLSGPALSEFEALAGTAFYRRFTDSGGIVATERRDSPPAASASGVEWAAVLEHERVPFVSYPYEWSFEMLRDAALLHLDLVLAALDEGMGLKDASAYNVQWKGVRPVFVDVASFYQRQSREPWVGYRQFCQMFLYPLLLQAYRDVPFQPWMRGSIDGIGAEVCLLLMGTRNFLRVGVFAHVYLQAKAQAAYSATARNVKADLNAAGFDTPMIKANASRLRTLVAGLQWKPAQSAWSEYVKCGHYDDADAKQKRDFVRNVAETRHWGLTWDIGANVGVFSRIVAERADHVIAMDADHVAVDRLYQALKHEGIPNVLPLVINVTDPSPALGWRNMERKVLEDRGRPELVLALALIHHVVIGGNIPMAEFIQWLRDLGGELIIEFVTREDPMVEALLRNKDDQYDDYDEQVFERELAARFTVIKRHALGSGARILYHARPISTSDS